jgi:hypothetical protein
VIEGKAEAVRLILTVLLAEGHVLIEDEPSSQDRGDRPGIARLVCQARD